MHAIERVYAADFTNLPETFCEAARDRVRLRVPNERIGPMRRFILFLATFVPAAPAGAQPAAPTQTVPAATQTAPAAAAAPTVPPAASDPLRTLAFLEGSWNAKATGRGGIAEIGTYVFRTELADHILARHSTRAGDCTGPKTFDCDHGDLLYVYADAPDLSLKAIYFDSEGHVIHYDVSTPAATTAVFLSDQREPGPQFRLIYELKAATMNRKFQVRMPGQDGWNSYLE
jgi:hypothetical protein